MLIWVSSISANPKYDEISFPFLFLIQAQTTLYERAQGKRGRVCCVSNTVRTLPRRSNLSLPDSKRSHRGISEPWRRCSFHKSLWLSPLSLLSDVQCLQAVIDRNHSLFFKLYRLTPNMGSYLLEFAFEKMRVHALKALAKA